MDSSLRPRTSVPQRRREGRLGSQLALSHLRVAGHFDRGLPVRPFVRARGDPRQPGAQVNTWWADRCGVMHCATISGIGSRIFCLAAKATYGVLRWTIGYSSRLFSIDIEPAFLGVISLSGLVIGRSSISASVDGRRVGLSSVFSSCWQAIKTANT